MLGHASGCGMCPGWPTKPCSIKWPHVGSLTPQSLSRVSGDVRAESFEAGQGFPLLQKDFFLVLHVPLGHSPFSLEKQNPPSSTP